MPSTAPMLAEKRLRAHVTSKYFYRETSGLGTCRLSAWKGKGIARDYVSLLMRFYEVFLGKTTLQPERCTVSVPSKRENKAPSLRPKNQQRKDGTQVATRSSRNGSSCGSGGGKRILRRTISKCKYE